MVPAYILRGSEWVEIGTATPHPDGKGHQLRFAISPADGDTVELRTADAAHIGGGQGGPKAKRSRTSRPRPRIGRAARPKTGQARMSRVELLAADFREALEYVHRKLTKH